MNDQRFDDLARQSAPDSGRLSRRDFLCALGLGGAAALAVRAGLNASNVAAQDATPAPVADGGDQHRLPGGPTVEQKAFDLEYDIERIFRFVADEVQYDAYPGVLRGAQGTLWSLAGNSADQALLLAALLEESLVNTRFVIGTLDDSAVTSLLETMQVDEPAMRQRGGAVLAPEPLPPDEWPELSPEQEQLLAELPERLTRIFETARSQLHDGVTTVGDALAEARIDLPPASLELPARERTQHVWVQYAAGAEWIDLDPSMPTAAPGRHFASPDTTLPALPDELHHEISLSIVAEVVSGEQPVRRELLSYRAFSQDLVGVPISLLHAKPEGLAGLGVSVAGTLEGSVQYLPSLVVAEEVVVGTQPVTLVTGEGVLSVFGPTGNEGDTLGEWIELTIVSPDAPPRTIVREVFDRVGYVERQTGTVDPDAVPPVELIDLDSENPQEYLPLRAIWSIAVAGGSVSWEYFDQDFDVVDLLGDLGLVSQGYHYIREALYVEAAADRGYRFFADQPNAIALVVAPTGVTEDGPRLGVGLDILNQSVAAAPLAGATPSEHPQLVAGVLSHVAERIAYGEWQEPDGEATATPPVSVGRIFEEAARQGIATRVIASDGAGAESLAVSEQATLRIADAISKGFVVIVPEQAVSLNGQTLTGWWLVDPLTGITADQMEDGRSQAAGEYTIPFTAEWKAIVAFARVAGCIGKVAAIAAPLLVPFSEVAGPIGTAVAIVTTVNDVIGQVPATRLC